MIKFAIGEYIRNIGYNIISIFLLAVTFIACTIFLTNFSEQQRLNNYLSEYLDDNSIIIANNITILIRCIYYFNEIRCCIYNIFFETIIRYSTY